MQHIERQSEQSSPPAQKRVRPEEMARALAAIEVRREQSSHEVAVTIPIGEAVQQLGFDVTPEEIWAEVQAQRARPVNPPKKRLPSRQGAALAAVVAILSVAGIMAHTLTASPNTPEATVTTPLAEIAKAIVVQTDTPRGPILCSLAEVPEGHSSQCSIDDLIVLNEYVNRPTTSEDWVQRRTGLEVMNRQPRLWTIVRYGNTLYLRGWTKTVLTPRAACLSGVTLYDTPHAPALDGSAIPVTVRITTDALPFPPSIEYNRIESGPDTLTVSEVNLDQHAWEKW